ncbi:uncharacterized protein LODBEIA_P29010 [Lodderomyces beijingensis]|uniref:Uncharacterized protein n=1 Tax=Lodderomyces beijingensis TaxID=1775926 RepID=A0ABP0ZMT7_9ASCO
MDSDHQHRAPQRSETAGSSRGSGSAEQTPTLKVVLLGDSGVGKTSLRSQFVHHMFSNSYKATIGGDYLTTTLKLPPSQQQHEEPEADAVNLQIWDTAGQERFNSISQAFYRGADVCVLVYDITNYESVLSLKDWFARFKEHCHVAHPAVVVVGNKLDKSKSARVVDKDEISDILSSSSALASSVNVGDYVSDWQCDLFEVSAKHYGQVERVFLRVAQVGRDISNSLSRQQSLDSFRVDLNPKSRGGDASAQKCGC